MFSVPLKVAALMREFEPEWFVAGGWAIDLYLGRETRPHGDVEIAIYRRDQTALRNYLDGWLLRKAENGVLTDWREDEFLELPIHEIHCSRDTGELRLLEVLLNETDGGDWTFRRNKCVKKPLSKLHLTANSGTRFLRPEVVLLYKLKNPRVRDEQDFLATVGHLDSESKEWLKNAILVCDARHHWLEKL